MARKKAFPFYSTRPVTMTTPTVFFRWQRARPGGGRSASSRDLLQYWLMASPSLFLRWPWPPLSLSDVSASYNGERYWISSERFLSAVRPCFPSLCIHILDASLCRPRLRDSSDSPDGNNRHTHTKVVSLYSAREREPINSPCYPLCLKKLKIT